MMIAILLVAGCRAAGDRPEPGVPTFPKMDEVATLQTIRGREVAWPRGSGRGELTLTRADGKSISLDAVFVLDLPGRLRLRAFKFTQAAFDVTYADRRLYLYSPRDPSLTTAATRASDGLLDSIERWPRLLRPIPAEDATARMLSNVVEFDSPFDRIGTLRSTYDRRTLLLRRQELLAPDGRKPFIVEELRYDLALTAGDWWPTHFVVKSPSGTIELTTRQWQPNVIATNAFVPPPRAVEVK